uniref:Uncharacterized protein n=1 Tax=Leersia perrieri TaxID=77586 RepID=A0A0D9X4W2_9ORYZ
MASPTSPSQFLPANYHISLRDTPVPGSGPHYNAVLFPDQKKMTVVRLPEAADTPMKGDGPKTNAVVEIKTRGGGGAERPTQPGTREGRGGGGGVIDAVVNSFSPQRPGAPAEGAGGNGAAVHAASSVTVSS